MAPNRVSEGYLRFCDRYREVNAQHQRYSDFVAGYLGMTPLELLYITQFVLGDYGLTEAQQALLEIVANDNAGTEIVSIGARAALGTDEPGDLEEK